MTRISVIAVVLVLLVAICFDGTQGGRVIRSPHHKQKYRGGGGGYQPVGYVVLQPVYGGGGHKPQHGGYRQPSHHGGGGSVAYAKSSSYSHGGGGSSYAQASSFASSGK